MVGAEELEHVRRIALALPGVTERTSHGAPCFYVGSRRALCYVHEHPDDRRGALWWPAGAETAEELVATEPDRFFRPTPSASGVFSDWAAMYLDDAGDPRSDWAEVAAVLEEAFRRVAPRRLVSELDER